MNTIKIRPALRTDLDQLYDLIQSYATQGIMLPRTKEMLATQLQDFIVAEDASQVVGCGSLFKLGEDLVEIRSLGLAQQYIGRGIGQKLLEQLIIEANKRHFSRVMALTYEVKFFLRNGFKVVEKEIFPEKVWLDCMHCPKKECCDEIAVLRHLN